MPRTLSRQQISAFRLARHHLSEHSQVPKASVAGLAQVCRAVVGLQAQLMGAAHLALWNRMRGLKPADLAAAFYQSRKLVKTSAMRQTLHLLPAADFHIYISALRESRRAALERMMSKLGISSRDVDRWNEEIVHALHDGPLTQTQLKSRLLPQASKQLKKYASLTWSIQLFRAALVEGLICYGPERDHKPTFVRVDQWLRPQKQIAAAAALARLLQQYLRAYGPARVQDFARWSGVPVQACELAFARLGEEILEVQCEGQKAWLLVRDYDILRQGDPAQQNLRLLGAFDSFMLGHVAKDHLVEAAHYKRVYRNQGWIAPVVLLDGRVRGVWAHQFQGDRACIRVEAFARFPSNVKAMIEAEVARLADFWQMSWELDFATA